MSALQTHPVKKKKALEEAYEEGFDMIFNYGYDCCSFTHNICGSQPVVPDRMADMSKPLSPEFFINPRCPSGVVSTEDSTINVLSGEAMIASEMEVLTAVLEADISEVGEHLSIAEVGLGNEPDSSAKVTRKSEEPDVSVRS